MCSYFELVLLVNAAMFLQGGHVCVDNPLLWCVIISQYKRLPHYSLTNETGGRANSSLTNMNIYKCAHVALNFSPGFLTILD